MTRGPQCCLVFVIVPMAADAIARRVLERRRHMTLFAGHRRMQAEQRKPRQAVVEDNAVAPTRGSVAAFALLAFLAMVDVVDLMTADALHRQFFLRDVATVAGAADQLAVLTFQRKLGAACVVKARFFPTGFTVAALALCTVTAVVGVVAAVATDAGGVGCLVFDRVDMAGFATYLCMFAFQGKLRVPIVIEIRFTPFALVVAVRTVRSINAFMHIVQRVTAVTAFRCLLVAFVDVTAVAGSTAVSTLQQEVGFVVVEVEFSPVLRGMTVLAVLAEVALVRVVFAVATAAA